MASSFSSTSITNPPSRQKKPSFPQTSHLCVSKRGRHPNSIVVTTTKNDGTQNDDDHHVHDVVVVDRRNMLFSLGGVAATAITGSPAASFATPVGPDVSNCFKTNLEPSPPGSVGKECCLNFRGLPIKDFRFQDYPTVMKTRRAAHKVVWDSEFHRDFKAAIAEMRKLDKNDPRSLYMQSLVHCAYCDAVYRQQTDTSKRFMVHTSWLFYPFHRWEIYFFERIAGKLIGKPDFALPFWAWDVREGMPIPAIYESDPTSSLYDATRNKDRRGGIINLDFIGPGNGLTGDQLVQHNLDTVYKQMVEQANSETFLGGKYKAGDDKTPGGGSIENGVHTNVHVWTGGNMGQFSTSGLDPLFYALHANVDRMWQIWDRRFKDVNSNYTNDDDFLNASFIFYDENAQPVRVYVKDCLQTEWLGYTYEEMPKPWLGEEGIVPGPFPGRGRGRGRGRGPGGHGPGRGWGRGPGGPGRGWGPGPGRGGPGGRGRGRGPGGPGGRGGDRGPGGRGWGRGGGWPVMNATPTAVSMAASSIVAYPLDKVVRAEVERPCKSTSNEDKVEEEEEEAIVVDMELSHTEDPAISFDVYINGEDEDYNEYEFDEWQEEETGEYNRGESYAGSFTTLPMNHGGVNHKWKTSLKLALNPVIEKIGAKNDETLKVTLVPRSGQDGIVITGMKIDYLRD